ncbi:MAG: SDR family oxidoreductase [Acidobacteriota bacterium]|nr:SDR family oxidoreductase [Acidobacteriota bacterium]
MSRIKTKIVLVAGGTGKIGGGIARKFLAAGARVVVPSRSKEKLADLRLRLSDFGERFLEKNLLLLEQDVGTETGAARVRDEVLQRYERIDTVVASLGGGWSGLHLVNVPLQTWNEILHDNLTAHFIVAKNFLPVLLHLDAGDYIFIAGQGGIEPVEHSIPVCASVAGEIMLACGLALENRQSGVRIHTVIPGAVETTERKADLPDDYISTEDIGEFVVELAACLKRFSDGKPILLAGKNEFRQTLADLRGSGKSRYL